MKIPFKLLLPLLYIPIAVVGDRIYNLAYLFNEPYLYTKIITASVHRFYEVCLLFYICVVLPKTWHGIKFLWKYIFTWRLIGLFFFIFIQFSGDHAAKAIAWSNKFRGSGAAFFHPLLGSIQEFSILFFVGVLLISLYFKSKSIRKIIT